MTKLSVLVFVVFVVFVVTGGCGATRGEGGEHQTRGAKDTPTCGYDSCTKPVEGMLNVHLVPHTHDDVGWLKTVDQYFYGSRSDIQKAGVQYILDSVIQELIHDPKKRFIYVETAFLWKWWMKQHDTARHIVKSLVNSGQLEVISGGWSMNDEAVTHYQSTIDQMTWGFRKLNDTFGTCGRPHIGWQIDPFGHSREQASLLAQMGFDGLFLGRIDFQDKATRMKDKTMDMVWEGSPNNLGAKSSLFTHVLYNTYSPPPGFCYDVLCGDEPIIDSKRSQDYNVPQKVEEFVKYVKEQAGAYGGANNVILTMGEDFNYQSSQMWYKNMDLVIKHVNAAQTNGSKVHVFYSTPSCFLKSLHDAKKAWPSKTDDFFPYASDSHAYWTGYFTSKPTIKYFERLGNNFLQVCKQLYAMADLGPEDWVDLNTMREAMGVMQHHDAITGTEKDHVAHDYARMLHEGFKECGFAANAAITKLTAKSPPKTSEDLPLLKHESCLLLNISSCNVTENAHNFVVTVYNPLGHLVSPYVRVPVTGLSYSVQDVQGKTQEAQMVPIHQKVVTVMGRNSLAINELVFRAVDLPPLGFRSYYVTKLNKINREESLDSAEHGDKLVIGDEDLGFQLNKRGHIKNFKINGVDIDLQQGFSYYLGMTGKNGKSADRASGAYIFRPNGTTPIDQPIVTSKVYKGALVDEVHQTFGGGWISQVIRVYKQENHAEFEWMVGPIPSKNQEGKEVITRYTTGLNTNGTFYTDSNGRELLKRMRDYRPTWKLDSKEPISSNYYPVTTKILMRDEAKNMEIAVVTDRAQGGTSLKDGQLELMVHRRLFFDDGFGVDEALNELQYGHGLVARGKHYLIGGAINGVQPSLAAQERTLAQRKTMNSWVFLAEADDVTFADWASKTITQYNGLSAELPDNVHVLTLEPWKAKTLLLRIEHIMEKVDDPVLSKPVTVNLQKLFTAFTIKTAYETTLGGNQLLKDSNRFQWEKHETNEVHDELHLPTETDESFDLTAVTLAPMQIRTFIVDIEANKY